jgi:hypothetical protein
MAVCVAHKVGVALRYQLSKIEPSGYSAQWPSMTNVPGGHRYAGPYLLPQHINRQALESYRMARRTWRCFNSWMQILRRLLKRRSEASSQFTTPTHFIAAKFKDQLHCDKSEIFARGAPLCPVGHPPASGEITLTVVRCQTSAVTSGGSRHRHSITHFLPEHVNRDALAV